MDTIGSTPALAAALRVTGRARIQTPGLSELDSRILVPMYRIPARTLEQEIDHAVRVIEETAERLRRLATAYGEWRIFDTSAYFDLTPDQAANLVYLVERVSSVHVRFFTDLLLPSFQQTLTFWQIDYVPAYVGLRHEVQAGFPPVNGHLNGNAEFARSIQPRMVEHWNRLWAVIAGVHDRLSGDITLISMSGSKEERNRWRHYWQRQPQIGLDVALLPALNTVRTLTLTFDFPLPASRQPDRLRRLRHNRQRRDRQQVQRR